MTNDQLNTLDQANAKLGYQLMGCISLCMVSFGGMFYCASQGHLGFTTFMAVLFVIFGFAAFLTADTLARVQED